MAKEVKAKIKLQCPAGQATPAPPVGPAPAAIVEETERIADWLERPGVRLIEVEGDWCWPLRIGPAASVQIRIGA